MVIEYVITDVDPAVITSLYIDVLRQITVLVEITCPSSIICQLEAAVDKNSLVLKGREFIVRA